MSDDLYRPSYPDGTHLAPSKGIPGAVRGGVLDNKTNQVVGQAEWIKVIEDSGLRGKVLVGAVALAAGIIAGLVIAEHAPKVKRWWLDTARWKLLEGLLEFAEIDVNEIARPAQDVAEIPATTPASFSQDVEVAVEDLRAEMTSEEAQQRIVTILLAAALIAEQLRALRNSRIEDGDYQALKRAMDALSTQDVADAINRMLESDSSLLDDETEAKFVEVFLSGQSLKDRPAPLTPESIEEALRLDGEDQPTEDAQSDDDE